MKDTSSLHLKLQGLLDCYLESNPADVLESWADNNWKEESQVDTDESCMKYIALILLDAIESRAQKVVLERGCPVLVVCSGSQHMLPAAPESQLSRGLEIVREICGIEGAQAKGTLCLGIRNSSLEFSIEKSEALHIIQLPAL